MELRVRRKHSEHSNPKTDSRTAAQRDKDRLIYSNAFRRLAGVTQVISPIEGNVVHNRLTHSLQVAQVARRLAERLIKIGPENLIKAAGGIDPDVAEAAGLAHDLGHPPFGHIGETQLNSCLADNGEEGYEGNAQSFRIITKLAVRSDEHVGLNLTHATLNAVLKYPWLKEHKVNPHKWGAYASEANEFIWARQGRSDSTKSIEAEIMDWADEVTYAVHDVVDFVRAGLIPLHLLVIESDELTHFFTVAHERWNKNYPDRLKRWINYCEAFKELITTMPIRGPYKGSRPEQALLKRVESELITRYINAVRLETSDNGKEARFFIDNNLKDEVTILKELNWHYVIEQSALKTQQCGYRNIIKELFNIYLKHGNDLVPNWISAELDGDGRSSSARKAADIVSSLSDSQAIRFYQRLTGLAPGSVRDWM